MKDIAVLRRSHCAGLPDEWYILNLHRVRDIPMHVPMHDWLFLLIGGVGFLAPGAALVASERRPAPAAA